ncbi:MAG: PAS domain S-box protein [bacterium]|nr:PAS domain S-box protein [bacterium]
MSTAAMVAGLTLAALCGAAVFSLRLIALTRHRVAWLLASSGLLLLAVLRVLSFTAGGQKVVTVADMVALTGALFLLGAMVLAHRVFTRLAEEEERQRRELARRDAMMSAVVNVAHQFLENGRWEYVLGKIIAELGTAMDVSRAYVVQIKGGPGGETRLSQLAQWCAPGIDAGVGGEASRDACWDEVSLPEWKEKMRRGEVVEVSVKCLPEPSKAFFDTRAITSLLLVPVFTKREWWGFLGVAECRHERQWSVAERETLRAAAAVLGSALAHASDAQCLADRELRYRTLFDLSPSGVVLEDVDGTIIDANAAFCRIFGYERHEILGRHVRMLLPVESQSEVEKNLARLREGERLQHVVTNIRKNGHKIEVELREACVRLPDGTRMIVVLVDDVTERVRMLKALCESEERFRLIFESCTLGIATMDLATQRLVQVNPALCRMLGYSAKDLCKLTLRDITPAEDWEQEMAAARPVREGKAPYFTLRKRYVRRDGSIFWGQLTASLVRDAHGQPMYGLGIVEDITTRLAQEQELLRARNLESLGLLAGGIAHDFNNILTVILGNASLARQLPSMQEAAAARLLEEIERAATRARGLTQQLLTFAKGGAPVRQLASLREVIIESALFASGGSACSCQFEIPEDLWPVEIDTTQMSQVFQNLVLNAVQAMPHGGEVRIRARNVFVENDERVPRGNYVEVAVIDRGVGISPEHLMRIFDPYFTTKKGGSGLGLTTALSIVQRHGGRIDVLRNEDEGMTFLVTVPARPELAVEGATKEQPLHRATLHGPARVLVLDDEEAVRLLIKRALEEAGYEVTDVGTGEEAIQRFQAQRGSARQFDLAILDLTVRGGIGGKEVLQALRRADPKIKALVVTGYAEQAKRELLGAEEFDGVVAKPFRIEDLCAEVQRVLRQNRGASSEQARG